MSAFSGISTSSSQVMPIYKRLFDIFCAIVLLLVSTPLLVIIALAVKTTSKGPILHWSNRIGQYGRNFRMPKFRSMRVGTPQLATHLLSDPARYVTPIGGFLRKSSLDELPQLFCVLSGDLSLVGPRPALFNQDDLVALRKHYGIDLLVPGITGWAQVNGRDELPIHVKVSFDCDYLRRRSFFFDLRILLMTARRVIFREGVSH